LYFGYGKKGFLKSKEKKKKKKKKKKRKEKKKEILYDLGWDNQTFEKPRSKETPLVSGLMHA